MSARHPKHEDQGFTVLRRKGSSQDRLNAEIELSGGGKRLIRERGRKKLFAQPRRLIAGWASIEGKWSGEALRHIRRIKGVGRPLKTRFTPDPVIGVLEKWGF